MMTEMNTYEAQTTTQDYQATWDLDEYREKFQACKKSWKMGAIFGSLLGVALTMLFSGFAFDSAFFCLLPFQVVSGIAVMAAVFGMKYTEGFGCSWIPMLMFKANEGFQEIFDGTYVYVWFLMVLIGIGVFTWVFGMLIFAWLFPLETLYYWIRARHEEKEPAQAA